MTKGSKGQDAKHEEQESVCSPKFAVELTSDRASAVCRDAAPSPS